MGALPSRETHRRGLYSHRHGRNRRSEIILIPLTKEFFPSADCPLFEHLYKARHRRTAKYYYRAVRSADTPHDSDYYCNAMKVSEPETFAQHEAELRNRRRSSQNSNNNKNNKNTKEYVDGNGTAAAAADDETFSYGSYSDTPEGLYQVLISENELCMSETDEELRARYASEVMEQRQKTSKCTHHHHHHQHAGAGWSVDGGVANSASCENVPFDAFLSGYAAAKQYMKSKKYHTHRRVSDNNNDTSPSSPISTASLKGTHTANNTTTSASSAARTSSSASHCYTRVTSPAAYYTRPIPCAIASRYASSSTSKTSSTAAAVAGPPEGEEDLYVPFEGFYVKIMGMFGTFPCTVPMAYGTRSNKKKKNKKHNSRNHSANDVGNGFAADDAEDFDLDDDDDDDDDLTIEQHLLKGTMFVDKDVGDQILGNMVMLATHMYVRQCVEAKLQPWHIPMQPYMMRFPLSNIPMLQFVREFRVRLRSLLEAGTVKSGQKPVHMGMSGFHAEDIASSNSNIFGGGGGGENASARAEEEAYVWEQDIPDVCTAEELFFFTDNINTTTTPHTVATAAPTPTAGTGGPAVTATPMKGMKDNSGAASTNSASSIFKRHQLTNTNPDGKYPILMISGFNVQSAPLRHAALNCTAATAAAAASVYATAPGGGVGGPHQRGGTRRGTLGTNSNATSLNNNSNSIIFHSNNAAGTPPFAANTWHPLNPLGNTTAPYCFGSPVSSSKTRSSTTTLSTSTTATMSAAVAAAAAAGGQHPHHHHAPHSQSPSSHPDSEALKAMMLTRRKNRFRLWIEDGHLCIWASAAYARRACLLLAQQLNTTVDSNAVPEQRNWRYCGVLHGGSVVPPPVYANDVMVVGEDIPAAGLWQGDVLRCCTAAEHRIAAAATTSSAAMHNNNNNNTNNGVFTTPPLLGLPLPCQSVMTGGASTVNNTSICFNFADAGSPMSFNSQLSGATAGGGAGGLNSSSSFERWPSPPAAVATTAPATKNNSEANITVMSHLSIGSNVSANGSPVTNNNSTNAAAVGVATGSGSVNYTSNHPSNPLLKEQDPAPPDAFWVRGSGGLDDSHINISESTVPINPKAEKQLQQAAHQRAKKAAAAAAAANNNNNNNAANNSNNNNSNGAAAAARNRASSSASQNNNAAKECCTQLSAAILNNNNNVCGDIDRREGTLSLEEVVLAWIRVVALQTRDASEEDAAWVRDPTGSPIRLDRYVIRRFEHDGVRYFIGVTPRFVGQQRRVEKVLGEVYALEARELQQQHQQQQQQHQHQQQQHHPLQLFQGPASTTSADAVSYHHHHRSSMDSFNLLYGAMTSITEDGVGGGGSSSMRTAAHRDSRDSNSMSMNHNNNNSSAVRHSPTMDPFGLIGETELIIPRAPCRPTAATTMSTAAAAADGGDGDGEHHNMIIISNNNNDAAAAAASADDLHDPLAQFKFDDILCTDD